MQSTLGSRATPFDIPATGHPLDPDLVAAVAHEAARDAEAVVLFLRELGLIPTADRPLRLPAPVLLHLAAALRLLAWEANGLDLHRRAGLPAADQAIRDAFNRLASLEANPPDDLGARVVALFADRLAWHGRRDLNADVELDDVGDEDALAEALAALLWQARHSRLNDQQSEMGESDD